MAPNETLFWYIILFLFPQFVLQALSFRHAACRRPRRKYPIHILVDENNQPTTDPNGRPWPPKRPLSRHEESPAHSVLGVVHPPESNRALEAPTSASANTEHFPGFDTSRGLSSA